MVQIRKMFLNSKTQILIIITHLQLEVLVLIV